MINLDGIQIEERELADLLKKLYISCEKDEKIIDSEETKEIIELNVEKDSIDSKTIAETEAMVEKMLAKAKREAEDILVKANKERESIIEQSREKALKEAEDIKSEALFQKGKLKEQELFFEKKMVILKAGFAQLEADKKAFEKEKREELEKKARANSYSGPGDSATMLFAGVNNLLALKKRYKDLIKIFHPDNLCGDTEVLQLINREYEKLMDEFGWVRKAY